MKKYIEITMEVLERLVDDKCVEGSLRRDRWTGRITFRAYNRQSRMHEKDRLVKKLPWGWVKESLERIKRFSSIPKGMTLTEKLAILDEENELAKKALIENYLIESV